LLDKPSCTLVTDAYALVLAAMAAVLLVTSVIVLALDRAIAPRRVAQAAPAE